MSTSAILNCCCSCCWCWWCWLVWKRSSDCGDWAPQLVDIGWAMFQLLRISGNAGLCFNTAPLSFISCPYTSLCTVIEMTPLCLSFPVLVTLLFFHTGQWSSPGWVSHQKETGFSAEGVSDRRQGRYRQFQHPSSAPSYAPGPSEEPAAGTTPRQCVKLHVEQGNIDEEKEEK